jgi:tetratricopeptide (TPR) repeat protein
LGAYLEKGKALEKLKRYEEAIESYKQTMELDDPTSYALLRIGKCYEKLGNKKEALDYYNKTVHEDPLLDKGWITITDFYIKLKEFQKALYHVNKALGIDNQNPDYWKKYAAINNALNFFEEAEYGYRKAIEYGDDDIDTWLFWVDLLLEIGETENALFTLHQAEEQHNNIFEIEVRLAGFYYTLGNYEKGKIYLTKALQNNTAHIGVLNELFPSVYELEEVQKLIKKYKN